MTEKECAQCHKRQHMKSGQRFCSAKCRVLNFQQEQRKRQSLGVSVGLLCKLGSILVHTQVGNTEPRDALMQDPEVIQWLAAMDAQGLLPQTLQAKGVM